TSEIRLYQLPESDVKDGAKDVASNGSAKDDKANGEVEPSPEGGGEQYISSEPSAEASAADETSTEVAQTLGAQPLTVRGQRHILTRPVLHDVRPAFDPDGRFLYFLSYREFNPVYDGLHFDLGFPWGMRPYLITLRADIPNPFIPVPDLSGDDGEDEEAHD